MVLIDVAMLVFTADGALKLILGSLIGLSLGLTGVGGGVLIIPVLQLFFGMGTIMAVGTASLISTLVKVNAGVSHIRAGNVEWGSLWFMLLGAVPSTLLITKVVIYLNAHDYYGALLNQLVDIAIVAVMLVSLLSLYWKKRSVEKTTDASTVVRGKPVALCAGGVCGAVLGSTGVGGGVMLLPAFNSLLGVDLKKSIGSSVVMALVLSGITAVSYSSGGQSELSTAILMTVGAFAGIPVAIRLVDKFTEQQLYSLTFTVIIVSLVLMLGF